jgi:hypothetical protein
MGAARECTDHARAQLDPHQISTLLRTRLPLAGGLVQASLSPFGPVPISFIPQPFLRFS